MTRALLALVLAGCAPTLVWHGRGPERRHELRVEEDGEGQRVLLDGEALARGEAVGLAALGWTDAGDPVYALRREGRWHVGVGAALGPGHEAVGAPVIAGRRVVYPALDGDVWRVIDGGEAGPPFASLLAGAITLAPEGRRLAYVGRDRAGAHAVIDGRVGPAWDDVLGLRFGAKGALVVHAGFDERGAALIVEGEVALRVHDVRELSVADDAPAWAAIVDTSDGRQVVRGVERRIVARHPVERADGLALAPDGGAVGWRDEAGVWVDGARVSPCARADGLALPGGRPVFRCHAEGGVRVHAPGPGPRFDAVDGPFIAGRRYAYVGHRRGAGSAVVIDGALVFRGEWAGALQLTPTGHAFLVRRGSRRFVVTDGGEAEVPRPFVDTLVYEGGRWAVAVADREARALRVLVDGEEVAELDPSELASALARGVEPAEAARAVVEGELRARRPNR